jgi:hypothetical protein
VRVPNDDVDSLRPWIRLKASKLPLHTLYLSSAHPQPYDTLDLQSCGSTHCTECRWLRSHVVCELPPCLHCMSPKPCCRSLTCQCPTCTGSTSTVSIEVPTLLYGNETVSRLKFGYKIKWGCISRLLKKILPHVSIKACPWWVSHSHPDRKAMLHRGSDPP